MNETRDFIKPGWVLTVQLEILKLQTSGPRGKLILVKSACLVKDIVFMESKWIYNPCFFPAVHCQKITDLGHRSWFRI